MIYSMIPQASINLFISKLFLVSNRLKPILIFNAY